MRNERLVDEFTEKAIVAHAYDKQMGCWTLQLANRRVAETIVYLNGMPWCDYGTIRIKISGKRRFTSWIEFKTGGNVDLATVFLYNPPTKDKKEVNAFINDSMSHFGLSQGTIAVLRCLRIEKGAAAKKNVWILETSSPEMAEKLMYLDGMPWGDKAAVTKLRRHYLYHGPEPKYRSFKIFLQHLISKGYQHQQQERQSNQYAADSPDVSSSICHSTPHAITSLQIFLKKVPASVTEEEIKSYLNQQMKHYNLSTGTTAIVACRQAPHSSRSWVLEMLNPEMAGRILYLNGMPWKEDGSYCAQLNRHSKYTGPAPKYTNFGDFIKNFETKRVVQEVATLQPGAVADTIESLEEKSSPEQSKSPHNVDLQDENEHLRNEIANLIQGNNDLQQRLSDQEGHTQELETSLEQTSGELETTRLQLASVHESWQDQVEVLNGKEVHLKELNQRLEDLHQHSQNVTNSLAMQTKVLVEERRERKLVEDILERLQEEPLRNIRIFKEHSPDS